MHIQPITEAELDVALRELSSGTAPGEDEIHCEEFEAARQGIKKVHLASVQLQLAYRTGAAKWRQGIMSAAEAEQASEQHGVLFGR
ncbi:hypothetical protein ERJ75_001083400 [Trypanosoma vivax]|nr:hypothetical protein ERJ75_001083400 [Trypanosoma vivax]